MKKKKKRVDLDICSVRRHTTRDAAEARGALSVCLLRNNPLGT